MCYPRRGAVAVGRVDLETLVHIVILYIHRLNSSTSDTTQNSGGLSLMVRARVRLQRGTGRYSPERLFTSYIYCGEYS
jgi:hypothetical protein